MNYSLRAEKNVGRYSNVGLFEERSITDDKFHYNEVRVS